MKLRLQSNSVRVRLSEPEVQEFATAGSLEEQVCLAPGQTLIYRVELADVAGPTAAVDGSTIRIQIPQSAGRSWAGSSDVELDTGEQPSGQAQLIIERDLEPRPHHIPR